MGSTVIPPPASINESFTINKSPSEIKSAYQEFKSEHANDSQFQIRTNPRDPSAQIYSFKNLQEAENFLKKIGIDLEQILIDRQEKKYDYEEKPSPSKPNGNVVPLEKNNSPDQKNEIDYEKKYDAPDPAPSPRIYNRR